MRTYFFLFVGWVLLLGSLALSGCLAEAALTRVSPSQTPYTPTDTPQPTSTVVWFPPTATFTPYPTRVITPTAEMHPGLGQVLLNDTFTNTQNWSLPVAAEGTVAMDGGELSIAIPEDRAYLYAVRIRPQLGNFYAEITASPTLCAGMDEYGLLLRFTSSANYDRISLTCDGQVRFDRVSAATASPLQPWMISGAFPPGAPDNTRLSVWAVGDELRVFINDIYQFTVQDTIIKNGLLGVFARSTGTNALTVRFSNLVVRQVNQ